MKNDNEIPADKTYLTTDEAIQAVKESANDEIPFPKMQPKRFTVHASVDPSKSVEYHY